MSEDKKKPPRPEDAEIEREIRSGRKFGMAEAIGRVGGGGLLKGGSPVPRKKQAELEIERYLEQNLGDSEGALEATLLDSTRRGDVLHGRSYDQPFVALAEFIEGLLHSEERLHLFVDNVDTEWGRIYSERPHFQKVDTPPDPDDPYTFASVRAALTRLMEKLHRG